MCEREVPRGGQRLLADLGVEEAAAGEWTAVMFCWGKHAEEVCLTLSCRLTISESNFLSAGHSEVCAAALTGHDKTFCCSLLPQRSALSEFTKAEHDAKRLQTFGQIL